MWLYDQRYDQELAALDHVPHGARMVSFVGRPCIEPWAMSRLLHVPGLAIVRNHAFSNDQWTMAGAQLLHVRYRPGWPFIRDATQVVTAYRCPHEVWRPINVALELVPRDAFDYIWLINPPPYDAKLTNGLTAGLAERDERALPGREQCEERDAGRERHPADHVALQPEDLLEHRVERARRHLVVARRLAGELAEHARPRRRPGRAGC